ncbi:MAG: right-handed parallel beta-helix repeat-containing protein, partial [Candidatus Tectomicrobia bacterium]|nr:right-handed parallel beta-helix repeat-containing protein [Candidatus Tectomicrobia bacterium]
RGRLFPRQRKLLIEPLEPRLLLSATPEILAAPEALTGFDLNPLSTVEEAFIPQRRAMAPLASLSATPPPPPGIPRSPSGAYFLSRPPLPIANAEGESAPRSPNAAYFTSNLPPGLPAIERAGEGLALPTELPEETGLEWGPVPLNLGGALEGMDTLAITAGASGEAVLPGGSLIYQPAPFTGTLDTVGEVDPFPIDLDSHQTLTLKLVPQEGSIVGQVALFGPDATPLGSATAGAAGETVVLQTVPIVTGGTFTFQVTSTAGTGAYEVQAFLNSALETESYSGSTNDDPGTAQDLTPSAVALPGTADRLAVVGRTGADGQDFYRFELGAGQVAYLLLTGIEGGALGLDLRDGAGNVLTLGIDDADNVDQAIRAFVAPAAGTYYARVTGEADRPYSLVITRGAAFDLDPNSQPSDAQDIGLTGPALGSLGLNLEGGGAGGTIRVAVHAGGYGANVVNQLNDDTFFDFNAVAVTDGQIDTVEELSAYDVVALGNPFDTINPQVASAIRSPNEAYFASWSFPGATDIDRDLAGGELFLDREPGMTDRTMTVALASSPLGMTGLVRLMGAGFSPVTFYQASDTAVYVEVVDGDLNANAGQIDTATVALASDTETAGGVSETVTLTETGADTGIFRGSIPLAVGGVAGADGLLAAALGDTVRLTYQDAADDWGDPVTTTRTALLMGTIVSGGSLAVDTTWSTAGGPYLITGDLSVNAGITLTVEPGVRVLFWALQDDQASGWWSNRSELIINSGGTLTAVGTADDPIIFTSSNPQAVSGDWGGIRFQFGGSGTLSYMEVSRATYGVQTYGANSSPLIENGVYRDNQLGIYASLASSPTISGNMVVDNSSGGIQVDDAAAAVSNNTVNDNQSMGIYAYASSEARRPTISGNLVTGNQGYGIYLSQYGAAEVSGNTITGNASAGVSYSNYANLGEAYPAITENTITGNRGRGVYLEGNYALARVNHNNIYDNTGGFFGSSYDLFNTARSQIDARFNYWGTTTTSEMDTGGNPKNIARIYDFYDDNFSGLVNYASWLAADYLSYPAAITISPNNRSLLIQWDQAVAATGYKIHYGTTAGVYDTTIDVGDVTHYLITDLTNDTPYYIALSSYNAEGEQSPNSAELIGVPTPGITNPTVISSSVGDGDRFLPGDLVYQVQFSEEMATENLGGEDVALVESISGQRFVPDDLVYDPETSTATVTYRNLWEGDYTLTLLSSATAWRSLRGLLLDGTPSFPLPSGDGLPGDPFAVHFSIDAVSEAYPVPLGSVVPLGSLIYDPPVSGVFNEVGDVDIFTLEVEGGQTITLRLTPQDASIVGRVEFLGPGGASLGVASATGAGETVLLQTVPIADGGTYELHLSNAEGNGAYEVGVMLNSALEEEAYGGAVNDALGGAQGLGASAIALQGSADRLAVLGRTEGSDDFFSFDLAEGQVAGLVLTGLDDLGEVGLDLRDSAGRLLAMGLVGANNVDQHILGFVAPTVGTYYARVTGEADRSYSLVVTRGAEFDLEPNSQAADAQDISLAGQVLGALETGGTGGGGSVAIRVAVHTGSYGGNVVAQLNDDTFFNFEAVAVTGAQIDTVEELNAYDVVVVADHTREGELASFAPALRAWVESGGGVVGTGWLIYSAGSATGAPIADIDAIIPVNTSVYYSWLSAPTLTIQDNSHPVTQGLSNFGVGTYVEYSTGGPNAGATVLATAIGQAAVVVGAPGGQGRSVWLGPIYMGGGGSVLQSGAADQLLEQAVAWAGNMGRADQYLVQANEGNTLVLTTTTPGDGTGTPDNLLDPRIELYDPTGILVAQDDNGATDGRNARIAYTVPSSSSGAYRVAILAADGEGAYTLSIRGATGEWAPFGVTGTDPADGVLLTGYPDTYRVDFSEALRLTSVEATDLLVNGVAADGVTIIDHDTLEFAIGSANAGDGLYTVTIPTGALTSLSNRPIEAFAATFDTDATNPTVITSSVQEGDILPAGDLVYTVQFSEGLATTGLGEEDVLLVEALSGTTFSPDAFVYDADTGTATVTYYNLREGDYTLTLVSTADAFRDRRGNLLDGSPSFPLPSGDGIPGDHFAVHFQMDVRAEPFSSTLEQAPPAGSLIYDPPVAGVFGSVGDVDAFMLDLNAGQALTIRLTPQDVSILGLVEVLDPHGTSVGVFTAGASGQVVILQNTPVAEAGTYSVRLSSIEGTGRYQYQVVLNASVEEEAYGSAFNDSLGSAQDLNGSAIALQGSADRLAALGWLGAADSDLYAFELTAGQPSTMVLTPQVEGTDLRLELLDSDERLLALGTEDEDDNQRIATFLAKATGPYLLRISGPEGAAYSLLVTRGAEFDQEPNFNQATAQEIGASRQVLGALGQRQGRGGGAQVAVVSAGNSDPFRNAGLTAIVNQLNDDTYFDFTATLVTPSQVDTLAELENYDVVVLGDTGHSDNAFQQIASALRSWVEAGGGLVATGWAVSGADYTSEQPRADFDAIVPVNTQGGYGYINGGTLLPANVGHPVIDGVASFTLTGGSIYTEYPGGSPRVDAGATTLATASGQPTVVVGNPGMGRSVYLGPIYAGSGYYNTGQLRSGDPDRLLEQAVAWAGSTDRVDEFRFTADEGDNLIIVTSMPGGGSGAPANTLDPRIELYNPLGFLVATDDNSAPDGRNARIAYPVPVGGSGEHRIRVLSENAVIEGGEYVLTISGATAAPDAAPNVVSAIPGNGQNLAAPPTSLLLTFSEALRVDSVEAADLSIDGGATVTGVELVDGKTVRFLLSAPDVEQAFHYNLVAGAVFDLQGLASLDHQGNFQIDHTGPRVVAQAPALQASAPFNELSFIFNEDLDPGSVGTGDIVSFTSPGGTDLRPQITRVSVTGPTVTVRFNDQMAQGTYTIALGPNIVDAAGNLMDQNQDRVGGQSNDTYTGMVDLQSPDLQVKSVTVQDSAQFGQIIEVSWTVRNIGSDPAVEGWSDRIWLSRNTALGDSDDTLLLTQTAGVAPLAAGTDYARTASVTLPLNASAAEGSHYIIVETDALRTQPESSETNNLDTSEAVSLTLPPIPDLVVSDIVAPIEAISGQQIPISWILTNRGTGEASGTWTDYVYLSADQAVGNDQFFGAFTFEGTLGAGQSVTRTQMITLPINLSGNRWVIVQTDANNWIFEHANEGNNTLVDDRTIDVRLAPLPNLQVTSVTSPSESFSGQQTVVEWLVTNIGTGTTSAPIWYDGVWLSLDRMLDEADVFLGQAPNTSYLAVGDSYRNSLIVTLPRGIDANYFFLVKTDSSNHVFEDPFEGDNLATGGPTRVQLTPPPDLRVASVDAPAQAFSGQLMTLNWTVANEGPGRTLETAWYDRLFMSADDVLDGNDRVLADLFHTGTLDSGERYTGTATVTLPVGVSGDFFFFARTDTFNHVYEHAFEGNNDDHDVTATHVNLTPPPDLEVEAATVPSTALASHPLTINYRATNFGATATPNASWTDSFYLSTDAQLDPETDLFLGDRTHFGALDVGASYDGTATFTLPNGLSGTFYAFVHTDQTDAVFELDNANNIVVATNTIAIESRPADLGVSAASAPASGEAGGQIRVEWTVSNFGAGDTAVSSWTDRVISSTDTVLGGSDDIVLASIGRNGLLNPGESYARSELIDIPFTFVGTYQLFIVADIGNAVYEGANEGNNSPALPITITRQTPDLQVTALTAPGTAEAGMPLTFSWAVENLGSNRTNSNYWYDAVYLSRDAVISEDDRLLGSVRHSNPLDPAGAYDVTSSFTIPADLAGGTYYAIVRTDNTNLVLEDPLENNNDRVSVLISIDPAPPGAVPIPDMVLVGMEAPEEAISGQAFILQWTMRNDGDPISGTWYDAVYLSHDQIFDRSNDIYVGYRYFNGQLLTGEGFMAEQTYTIPRGLSGPFYVFVATDSGNHIKGEVSEFNNVGYDPVSMLVTLMPPADLVVGTITVPSNAVPGHNATISYSVRNEGTNSALGSWYDSIYISADDRWEVGDALFGRVIHNGDVPGGSSYSEILTATLPGVMPGDYHVIIRSDILNHISESNEGNNIGASLDQVAIDAEPLQLGVPSTGTLAQGQAMYYRIDVGAEETLRLRLDSESENAANELYVRFGAMPSRSEFDFSFSEPFSPDQQVVIPATENGTYYILAYSASVSEGVADYTITATALPFSIDRIFSTQGGNVGQVTVQIDGAKFDPLTRVELIGGGQTTQPVRFEIIDPTRIYATFDLTGKPAGLYDVRAVSEADVVDVNPETGEIFERHKVFGDSTLPGAFEVMEGGGPIMRAELSLPSAARFGSLFTFFLNIANEGNTDLPVPVLLVTSPNGTPLSDTANVQRDDLSQIQIVVLGERQCTVLAPGEHVSVPLFARAIQEPSSQFELYDLTSLETPPDWDALELYYRDTSPEVEWTETWKNFQSIVGDTWSKLHDAMRKAAADLLPITGDRFFTGTELILNLLSRARFGQHGPMDFRSEASEDTFGSEMISPAVTSEVIVTSPASEMNPLDHNSDHNRQLDDKELWFRNRRLPLLYFGFGNTVGDLWNTYLSTSSTNPSQQFTFTDRHEVVEGSYDSDGFLISRGFKYSLVTQSFVSKATRFAREEIESMIRRGQIQCDEIPENGEMRKSVEELFADHFELLTPNDELNYRIITEIPGNIAGGTGTSDFYGSDTRRLSGDVILTKRMDAQGRTVSVEVKTDFIITVEDTIDFFPDGDLGSWAEQKFGTPILRELEQYDWAHDVPFTVQFKPESRTFNIRRNLLEDCDPKEPLQPPAPSSLDPRSRREVPTVRPIDPNDIVGPAGFGAEHWITSTETIPYTIRFENAANATAPAQQVVITQQLDPDLDWRTFRVDDFGWGDLRFELPGDKPFYNQRLDLREELGFFVDVSSSIDVQTGLATWTITTIDPETGEPPADAQVGFLPVDDGTGRGEGFVSYTVRPRRTAGTGDVIDAQARIIFDTEEPIDTPPIFHTLDAVAPTSAVNALPETTEATEFLVSWSGSDDEGGSAVSFFDVFVSTDGDHLELWLLGTASTEALYTGQAGHSYAFYSVASDNAGNEEAAPETPDARITVLGEEPLGSIQGTKFEDLDGNGVRDEGEPGLEGWTIYLDSNGNGLLDQDERSTLTDAQGNYLFDDLVPGTYVVAELLQEGWMQTFPGLGGQSASALEALSTTGSAQELRTPAELLPEEVLVLGGTDTGWADRLTRLDDFRADPRFAGIDGEGLAAVIIDSGIDLDHPFFGPDQDHNGVGDRIVFQYDFADHDADASDSMGHGSVISSIIGSQDGTYAGVAPGVDLIALKVFEDSGRGYFAYLEQALQWVVAHAEDYNIAAVNLSLGDGANWGSAVSLYGLGDELAAMAEQNILVVAAGGNSFYQFGEAGAAYPAADPHTLGVGAVWSGDYSGPWRFSNGAIDYTTGADHLASFSQRDPFLTEVFAPGARLTGAGPNGGTLTMQGTSQAAAYVSGAAVLAQQIAQQELGRKLSVGEFARLLTATGEILHDGDDESDNVANTGLNFARIDLLSLAEGILTLEESGNGGGDGTPGEDEEGSGITPVTGASLGSHTVSLGSGETVAGIDFGNFELGEISGVKFHDLDNNGLRGEGEPGLAGWTIYLDGNGNGTLDQGESSTTTDETGAYAFTDLGPGTYRVAEVMQEGWTQTAPAGGTHEVMLTSGLVAAGKEFGNRPANRPPVANDDAYHLDEDTSLTVDIPGVLENDTDAENNALTAARVDGPAHGTLTLNPDGSFTYTPTANYSGTDSFTYRANDGIADSAPATVTLTINEMPEVPVNVDGKVQVTFSGYVLNRSTNTFDTLATITNTSGEILDAPMSLVVTSITPTGVSLFNPTGYTDNGKPFIGITVPQGGLQPGASISGILLKFRNLSRVRFSFTKEVWAVVLPPAQPAAAEGINHQAAGTGIGGDGRRRGLAGRGLGPGAGDRQGTEGRANRRNSLREDGHGGEQRG